MEIVDKIVTFKHGSAMESTGSRVKFGRVMMNDELLDEVLVSIFKAPHSYTGEDSCELSCHASAYIVSGIIELLIASGCRLAGPGEFTQRAFLNGKMDLTQAEAVADLIASGNEASHRVAINQLKGGFSNELSSLRARLLEMTSLMELELDFSEEDVEFADRSRLNTLLETVLAKISSLCSSFKLGNAIKNGVPVAIVGATNAGKSTLLNAILGEQRAIVSDIAGTTRDTIEECFNVDGILFRFVDTAGIRSGSRDSIENIGMQRSFESIRKAEVVLVLIDSFAPDFESLEDILNAVDWKSQKVIFVLNKCDLGSKNAVNKNVSIENIIVNSVDRLTISVGIENYKPVVVRISAKSAEGIENLLKLLSEMEKSSLNKASEAGVLITNMRHYQALKEAASSLRAVQSGLSLGTPTDLVAEDLRSAISTLGSITGEISTTDVLNNIFANFCIGK